MWSSHAVSRAPTVLAAGATVPRSTSATSALSAFCASRLVPRKDRDRYCFFPLIGSTPSKARSCHEPGLRSRIEPLTAVPAGRWTADGQLARSTVDGQPRRRSWPVGWTEWMDNRNRTSTFRRPGQPSNPLTRTLSCALGRIRTCDARFRKPTLYPLSYEGGMVARVEDMCGTGPTQSRRHLAPLQPMRGPGRSFTSRTGAPSSIAIPCSVTSNLRSHRRPRPLT